MGGMQGQKGQGFFSTIKRWINRAGSSKLGKKIISSTKNVLAPVAKDLALAGLNVGTNKLLEEGARNRVPDGLLNVASDLSQQGLNRLDKKFKTPKQSRNEKAVSGFVSDRSQDLLQSLLSRGRGVKRHSPTYGGRSSASRFDGSGVNLHGGKGIFEKEA